MQSMTGKVTASHLGRDAYLYIRQSSLRQVLENQESTKRQYALREKAIGLGWPLDRIHVIDNDLGQSGASSTDREGFKELVSEVSLGRAGIVIGLEVSRLARNNSDWHRLLELCGMSETLIMDDDGLYNPNDFNDRLILGLKGTMSEAELHLLRARLRGGIINKAKRGELPLSPPIGFVHDANKQRRIDPDQQVQMALKTLFQIFHSKGTARQVVQYFSSEKILFPRRIKKGPGKGTLQWGALTHHSVLRVLHNPCYAGAFAFGRHRARKTIDGKKTHQNVPMKDWQVLVKDVHDRYISWEEYEENQRRLLENAQGWESTRSKMPAREGSALLQGIAICGKCGRKMTAQYNRPNGKGPWLPTYACTRSSIELGARLCNNVPGVQLDAAIGTLLLERLSPHMLAVAIEVQGAFAERIEEVRKLRQQQVERAHYDAELARSRFVMVDPHNRLVAEVLEAEWNEKLRQWQAAQEDFERECRQNFLSVSEEMKAKVLSLATDLPALWNATETTFLEKKRILRLLIEDVTLIRDGKNIKAHVRFKGGASETLSVLIHDAATVIFKTPLETVQAVDKLLDSYAEDEIAEILTRDGYRAGRRQGHFSLGMVRHIRLKYGLKSRFYRLREKGFLTIFEISTKLGVNFSTVKNWRDRHLLKAYRYSAKDECLYEDIAVQDAPKKFKHKPPKFY